ncbi:MULTISPECIES: hypothetical protein [Nostoc]|uniref:Uncharacterized protein n=1 Tax=Nostoc linckia FACHB-391 TaxID=2692906 RepID=A0ABR8EX53_NOSLI|nr:MULTISPECIES: hypothetical protein [Nostoc]MBD2561652.1 hypothetical protein [Nostoc linckia FACHB-391]
MRNSLKIWRSLITFGGFDDRKPWYGSFADFQVRHLFNLRKISLNNRQKLLHHFLQVHQYYFRIFCVGVARRRYRF